MCYTLMYIEHKCHACHVGLVTNASPRTHCRGRRREVDDGRLLSRVDDGAAVLDLRYRAGRRSPAGGGGRVANVAWVAAARAVVGERRAHRQEGEQGEDRGHLERTELTEITNGDFLPAATARRSICPQLIIIIIIRRSQRTD